MKAYCGADGGIHFGPDIPEGMLLIAEAPEKYLRKELSGCARHSYDGETLLVPGVPEAPDQEQAMDALLAFKKWIAPRFTKKGMSA